VSHVVQYDKLLDAVSARAQLPEQDDAKSAVKAVLAGIAHWVDVPERQAVADILPLELRYVMESPRPTVGGDLPRFLQFVAFVVDTTPDRARQDSQAVLSVLRDSEPDTTERLRKALPGEFASLFTAPAEGEAPERDAAAPPPAPLEPPPVPAESAVVPEAALAVSEPVAAETEPTPVAEPEPAAVAAEPEPEPAALPAELTADEISTVLRRLPGWRGNTRRLSRTVPLPHGRGETVIEEIHRIEQQLDHHAQVKQGPEDLTLTLWTHSRDGVTELDVQLAERIHAVLTRL
jgi:pterin-4a-carbinolamine dehydratase/uncharacterized protein (DUF2267 family)